MAGLLMNASADDFEDFAERFREFAIDEFKASATLLPKEYQPHYNLGTVNEAAGKATTDSNERYKFFAAAIDEYLAAARASEELTASGKVDVQRKITVGLLHAQLVSDMVKLRDSALNSLMREKQLNILVDWPVEKPKRFRPIRIVRSAIGWRQDDATAECLYNSACMYSLAADAAADGDYCTRRDDWDQHARRLLGAALAQDGGYRYLWTKAGADPDLRRLSYHFQEFTNCLREALVDGHPAPGAIAETLKIVDEARDAARWDAHPSAHPWWSTVAQMGVLRRLHLARGG